MCKHKGKRNIKYSTSKIDTMNHKVVGIIWAVKGWLNTINSNTIIHCFNRLKEKTKLNHSMVIKKLTKIYYLGAGARWRRSKRSRTPLTNTSKKTHLHVKRLIQNINWMCAKELKPPKRARNSWHNWVEQKKKRERKGIRTGLAFLRGSREGEKKPTFWEAT